MSESLLFTPEGTTRLVHSWFQRILASYPPEQPPLVVAIQKGGVPVVERLLDLWEKQTGNRPEFGTLDVSMHRDDLSSRTAPLIEPTDLPADLVDRDVLLVDDVIQSGRTIRAAMDSLHDFGRPSRVRLAVLIDRGDRQVPICPDFTGRQVTARKEETIAFLPANPKIGDRVVITRA